jgi:hypothetical protein
MVSYRTDEKALELYAGSAWQPVMQGRNAVINGGMDVFQRGTTFSASNVYTADRWSSYVPTGTCTYTRETTIKPDDFVASIKLTQSVATGSPYIMQSIETLNTMPLVGKTVTISAYVYGSASISFTLGLSHSSTVDLTPVTAWSGLVTSVTQTVGSTWTRISATGTVPTTARSLRVELYGNSMTAGQAAYFTGVQVELGSVATPFVRAGGTLQGELAACQRYYYRSSGGTFAVHGSGQAFSTTQTVMFVSLPVPMRTTAISIDSNAMQLLIPGFNSYGISALTITTPECTTQTTALVAISSGLTQHRQYYLSNSNNAAGYIGISAEL